VTPGKSLDLSDPRKWIGLPDQKIKSRVSVWNEVYNWKKVAKKWPKDEFL
jgi:hypothetical protein